MSVIITGCGSGETQQVTETTPSPTVAPTPSPTPTEVGKVIELDDATMTITVDGTGDKPTEEERIFFEYTILNSDGSEIESETGEPMSVVIGSDHGWPVWQNAVRELRVGGEAMLELTSDLIDEFGFDEELTGQYSLTISLKRIADPITNTEQD